MKNTPCVLFQNDKPTIYNKGTKDERVYRGPFLECYAYSYENAQKIAEDLNKTATGRYYYASYQEEMGN